MRKLTYALAAAATLAIGAPTIANAEGFGVYVGGDHGYYGDRYDGPRVRIMNTTAAGIVAGISMTMATATAMTAAS